MRAYRERVSLSVGTGRLIAVSEFQLAERISDHSYTTGVSMWIYEAAGTTVVVSDPSEIRSFFDYTECSLIASTLESPIEMAHAIATLMFPGHSVLMTHKELELLRFDPRAMKQFTPPDDISPRFVNGRLEFWVQHYFVKPTEETFLWSVTCDIGGDNSLAIEKKCAARWMQYRA